jgi:hypothetical protein
MGYETKLYLAMMSEYEIPEEHRENGREITAPEYKSLVEAGARLQHEYEPLQRIYDEELEHEGHTKLKEELHEAGFDAIWDELRDFRIENMVWAQIIGMVDMCKLGYDGSLVSALGKQSTGWKGYIPYFFGTDGNSMVFEDCYGDGLGVHDPKEVMKAAHAMYQDEESYRRLAPFIGMVAGALQHDWSNLVVLSYGY